MQTLNFKRPWKTALEALHFDPPKLMLMVAAAWFIMPYF